MTAAPDTADFIPATARPLFKDRSIYDLDASLKEMMGKCSEAVRKYFKKSHSVEEFHKILAQILHMYILPSITFNVDDILCLKRAQDLIEARLAKSENEITVKACSIENVKKCLWTLKQNLLVRESLDSERYLQTCNRDFLITFLKTVESDIVDLNIELAAEQSKINWAREHPLDNENLSQVKERRDNLFHEINKLIRVREAIKNVISRKNLTRRKVKKAEVVSSCLHNIFVELVRRLEKENHILSQLGNDKVNICATREAVVCTLLEIVNNNRNSDRATQFEPEDFADFSVGEAHKVKKSGIWLTFQERVARVLEQGSSAATTLHKDGCKSIISKINIALSEFKLVKRHGYRFPQHRATINEDRNNSRFYVSLDDVSTSEVTSAKSKRRHATLINTNNESFVIHDSFQGPDIKKAQTLQMKSESEPVNKFSPFERKAYSTVNIYVNEKPNKDNSIGSGFNSELAMQSLQRHSSESSFDSFVDDEHLPIMDEESDSFDAATSRGGEGGSEGTFRNQRHVMTEQLALSSLMNSVENLKVQIQSHFKEVIKLLDQELRKEDLGELSGQEHKELLWKSYERFFCQVVY